MMKGITIFLICLTQVLAAQKFSVKGQVVDSLSASLPSATVMLLNPKDSTLVNFGVTDSKGFFEIKNVNKGAYQLKITFVGFAPFVKNFATPETNTFVDLGVLRLEPESRFLESVTVVGEKAPVTVKRDTIEFNADSFKTKANANVEDLLKKLPGVEVETDGTIRAQGEQVQRVTVDGREFFGRDPKLATRNLPADAVDKVQVFDKKSEQSTFTGIEDGTKEKAINLELKEEKRNAAFGNMMAGAGSDNRFQAKANINRFTKGRQLSFLGMGNNINEQGFSVSDYMNFSGGPQQMGGGGGQVRITIDGDNSNSIPLNLGGRQNGIMTNYAGGFNLNQDYNKGKTKVGGSYFYNRLEQNIVKDLHRINYLPEDPTNGLPARTYNFDQSSRQFSANDNHRINMSIDHQIDSANSIRFNATGAYNSSTQKLQSESYTQAADNTLQNSSVRETNTAGTTSNLNSSLLWRHKFEKKGRTFSSNFTFNLNESQSNGNQLSTNDFYGTIPEKRIIDQTNDQNTLNQTSGAALSYTEPLGKRRYIEANYNFRINTNEVLRNVFNRKNNISEKNYLLSNEYTSNYTYNRPGLNFRMNRQKFNITLGASYQMTALKGNLIARDTVINRSFQNLLPVARFNYDFSSFKHLRFDYEASMREPSIQQLQPVIDNSDPLNISIGNPSLKPTYSQNVSLNFTTFDPAKFVNFFAFLTAVYQTNAITTSQFVDDRLIRTSIPVNVKDNLNLSGNMNFGFPIKKLKSRFNIGPNVTNSRGINVLNNQESSVKQNSMGGNFRYNFTYKEIFILDLSANIKNQKTEYETVSVQDQEFINKTYSAETSVTIKKNYQFNSSFDFYQYDSRTTSFRQSIPILNVWLSRFFLKGNSGEIKIGVSNLLDKSLSVTQTATANFLQQETSNNLGRFFMVSFTYALNKQLNPFGGGGRRGPGGGMRMMIRQD